MTFTRRSYPLTASVVLFTRLAALLLALVLAPTASWACACGCGVFDVGTSSLFPGCKGATAFVEADYLDQTRNWSGDSRADPAGNGDKNVRSAF